LPLDLKGTKMDKPILKDPNISPDMKILKPLLGDSFPAYEDFIAKITEESVGLNPEWIYYKDVKAWLCKISFKKKTVIWLSAQDGHFRITFYFNKKTIAGFYELPIAEVLKNVAKETEEKKFIPVTIEIPTQGHLEDILQIIEYKKKTK
jgi:hypothetical protein